MVADPIPRSPLIDPRLVRHETDWERQAWVLHDPRGGTVERAMLVGFSVALAALVGRLAVSGRTEPEHFLVFGMVGLVMLAGVVATYTGRHVALKVSRDGVQLEHLEGLLPDEADLDSVWSWPATWSTTVPWTRIRRVSREPGGRLRLVLVHGEWTVGTMRASTLDTLVPAIEQGIRTWGAHRQRPDGALADVQALRGRASSELA